MSDTTHEDLDDLLGIQHDQAPVEQTTEVKASELAAATPTAPAVAEGKVDEASATVAKERTPFATMTCPIDGCDTGKGGEARQGSVPGIKRHVRRMHPAQLGSAVFPDIH